MLKRCLPVLIALALLTTLQSCDTADQGDSSRTADSTYAYAAELLAPSGADLCIKLQWGNSGPPSTYPVFIYDQVSGVTVSASGLSQYSSPGCNIFIDFNNDCPSCQANLSSARSYIVGGPTQYAHPDNDYVFIRGYTRQELGTGPVPSLIPRVAMTIFDNGVKAHVLERDANFVITSEVASFQFEDFDFESAPRVGVPNNIRIKNIWHILYDPNIVYPSTPSFPQDLKSGPLSNLSIGFNINLSSRTLSTQNFLVTNIASGLTNANYSASDGYFFFSWTPQTAWTSNFFTWVENGNSTLRRTESTYGFYIQSQ